MSPIESSVAVAGAMNLPWDHLATRTVARATEIQLGPSMYMTRANCDHQDPRATKRPIRARVSLSLSLPETNH